MHIDPAAHHTMLTAIRGEAIARVSAPRTAPRTARRSPWMHLLAALLELAGGRAELLRHSETAWSSVTFSGTRHSVWLAFSGAEAVAAGEAFIDALPEHEFSIPRQLVADAAVAQLEHTALPEPRIEVEIELLLLDEC